MLISKKTTGSIYLFIYLFIFFFASKEAYPIVRQLQKNNGQKAQAKEVKCAKNKCWIHRTPRLGHLSVKNYIKYQSICSHILCTSCLPSETCSHGNHTKQPHQIKQTPSNNLAGSSLAKVQVVSRDLPANISRKTQCSLQRGRPTHQATPSTGGRGTQEWDQLARRRRWF